MGLFSSKKSTVTQEEMMPSWQLQTGNQLANWIMKNLGNYTPGQAYTGQLTAGISPYEQMGLSKLDSFLNAPATGDLYSAAKTGLMDTLGGTYANAQTSPWIKSMTNLSKLNLQDTIDQIRAQRGGRGNYFTTEGVRAEGEAGQRSAANLDALVSQFIEQERGRQFQAIPLAQQLEQYGNITAPLAQISASQSYGALPRLLEQADLEAKYNEFKRQREELSSLPQAAQSMYNTSVPYGIKSLTTKSPSTFMSMLGEMVPGIGSYNTHEYGYDTNQSSIKAALDAMMGGGKSGGSGGSGGGMASAGAGAGGIMGKLIGMLTGIPMALPI